MAKKFSFASVMGAQPDHKVVNLSELRNDEVVEGAAVTLPLAAVEEVNARFTNTLYGYFIGKRLAFKLVENYVKNTWAKFGIKRIQLHDDFFLFQFDSKAGMERVLETGPWLIRRVPLILNMWSPNVELKKDEVKTAPVWIKLHHVPIVAYTEVGLSLITTQIGKPIMLDSYTCNMCVSSWGRSSYARALIEVSAEKAFMESIVIAIPLGKDKGHSLATVEIEYEWKPPRCAACLVFDHTSENCPKKPKVIITSDISANDMVEKDTAADGFEVVKKKRNKKKKHQKQVDGVVLNKPSLTLHYRRVDRGNSTKQSVLMLQVLVAITQQVLDVLNESDSDVDEVITLDDRGCAIGYFVIDTHVDLPQWRDSKGVLSMFSVRGAWEALRLRGTELCDAQPDSHEHLFFECPYSARIWILIRSLTGMELISPRLHDIISYLQPIAHRRNARSVIGRILVAAAAYFIWVEQNNRVFKNSRRSLEELLDAIIVTVRLKLLTFRFKNTTAVQDILARWKMPSISYQMRHVALVRGSSSYELR
ncbi:zinc knuckle CX2CX4HX4C containing protein [Tanacetum coccineum]